MKTAVNFSPRTKLLTGVNTIAEAVASSLGPMGQNVAIAKTDYQGNIFARDVIHDGVKIAKSIDLPDEEENMGAQILKEAAQKQVDSVGDGTTVVMVLAQALVQSFFLLMAMGDNPMPLRKELENNAKKLIAYIESLSIPITTKQDAIKIARISAQDDELGELVAHTIHDAGEDGIVVVEESKSTDTHVQHQEGMQLASGYAHALFMTNPDRLEAVSQNARILVTDIPIPGFKKLIPLAEECSTQGKHLVVISPDFQGDTLPTFIQNKMQGNLMSLCIKAPSFGPNQRDILDDIAVVTGSTFYSGESGHKLEDVRLKDLGSAEYVNATKSGSVIVGGKGAPERIQERIVEIKTRLTGEESSFETVKLQERLAKLTSGVRVIYVGGVTEVEMKERRERAEDALQATKAALKSGIVPGGEIVYLKARETLDQTQVTGRILYNALGKPFTKLMENAGLNAGRMIERLEHIGAKIDHAGIDLADGQVKDLVQAGIIDPVAVPMHAIENAVSVAVQIVTSSVVITPEKKEA